MKFIRNTYRLFFLLTAMIVAQIAWSQQIKPDPDYGTGGLVKSTLFKGRISKGNASFIDSFGNARIFGASVNQSYYRRVSAIGLLFNGKPDPSFGIGGSRVYQRPDDTINDSEATCFLKLKDGGFLLGGFAVVSGGNVDALLLRIKSNGEPDSSWGNHGFCIQNLGGKDVVNAIVPLPDGTFRAVCGVQRTAGFDSSAVWKINNVGKTDSAFGWMGHKTITWPVSLYINRALLCDSTHFYISGYDLYQVNHPVIGRLDIDGKPDSSFNSNGFAGLEVVNGKLNDLLIVDSLQILACGYTTFGNKTDMVLFRFYPNGSPDNRFSPNGRKDIRIAAGTDMATSMVTSDSGDIYILGLSENTKTKMFQTALIKISRTGLFFSNFGNMGNWTAQISPRDDAFSNIYRDRYSRIYLAGTFQEYGSVSYFASLRVGYSWPLKIYGNQNPNTVNIYPNPATDKVLIESGFKENMPVRVSIYNANGQRIYFEELSGAHQLNLHLPAYLTDGLYFVSAVQDGRVFQSRFIKQ